MDDIAIIDWHGSVKKMEDEEAAKILLQLFIAQLPDARKDINEYAKKGNLFRLENEVKKLLSSCCYCCLPRLEAALEDFRQVLGCMAEKDLSLVKIYVNEFNEQVDAVLAAYQARSEVS